MKCSTASSTLEYASPNRQSTLSAYPLESVGTKEPVNLVELHLSTVVSTDSVPAFGHDIGL